MTPGKFELVDASWASKPFFAARILPLGLTAYGDTKEEAVEKLKKMVVYWIDLKMKNILMEVLKENEL